MKVILFFILTLSIVGCGNGIPKNYRGTFADPATDTTLVLNKKSGSFVMSGVSQWSGSMSTLSIEDLTQGEEGIFYATESTSGSFADVFWVRPSSEVRNENGFLWRESEVLYTSLDLNRRTPAESLHTLYCEDGEILVDLISQNWQIGCPPTAKTLILQRVN